MLALPKGLAPPPTGNPVSVPGKCLQEQYIIGWIKDTFCYNRHRGRFFLPLRHGQTLEAGDCHKWWIKVYPSLQGLK